MTNKRFKTAETPQDAAIITRYNQARNKVESVTNTARMLGTIGNFFNKKDFKNWFDAELNSDGFFPDKFVIHLYLEYVVDVEPEEAEIE